LPGTQGRVAVARDPSQAIPLSGTYAGSPEDELGMKVQVNVICEEEGERDAGRLCALALKRISK
jgi:hypothetical protein